MRFPAFTLLFLIICLNAQASDTLKCPGGYFDSTLAVQVYEFVEIEPSFPGGEIEMIKFIRENLRLPEFSEEEEIVSITYVGFTVLPSGKLVNIHVIKPSGVELNPLEKEAMRLITIMPDWIPGTCNGYPVAVEYSLPLRVCLK